jgi:hypothetical protein
MQAVCVLLDTKSRFYDDGKGCDPLAKSPFRLTVNKYPAAVCLSVIEAITTAASCRRELPVIRALD